MENNGFKAISDMRPASEPTLNVSHLDWNGSAFSADAGEGRGQTHHPDD